MKNLIIRDCGIPDFKLLRERIIEEVVITEEQNDSEEWRIEGKESETGGGQKSTEEVGEERENGEIKKESEKGKKKKVAVLVESDKKMKQLKPEILSKIPSSGVILIFRVDRGSDRLVPFKIIRSEWELKKAVGRCKIGEEGLFEHMRVRVTKGDAKRFIFLYAPL